MEKSDKFRLTKYACYLGAGNMATTSVMSPLLFVTFHDEYGISYTLLGLLVAVNFLTQLSVDLLFSFFPKYFNIHKTLRAIPVVVLIGFVVYAVMPWIMPSLVYLWLVLGTLIFSAAAGLGEVLFSPTIAAMPSDNPEREMSKLHSSYAWGCVFIVVICTAFLEIFGTKNWQFLALLLALLPLLDAILFALSPLPDMDIGSSGDDSACGVRTKGFLLFIFCIFLGGASEVTMSEWVSSFIENGIGLPKIVGDLAGVALFSVMLGIGRSGYARFGKNVSLLMLIGMIGASVCYVVASLSPSAALSLIACAVCGLCVSMLWPGTLIFAEQQFSTLGVASYALLAAGGDLGASVAPQMVGIVSDAVALSPMAEAIGATLGITAEQVGMRAGILSASLFPLIGIAVLLLMRRRAKKKISEAVVNEKQKV